MDIFAFYMILYQKKPVAHDVLPDETQVETQYVKFNVKPDEMVTFAFNFGQTLHSLTNLKRKNASEV